MSNNHNKPRTYLNGKPYDFSAFYVPDEVKGCLAEEPAGNPAANTESAATSTGKPLQPGEAFANRIGLGDVKNVELPVALDTKETNE